MDISNQLRVILLVLGVVAFVAIYFFSRRGQAETGPASTLRAVSKPEPVGFVNAQPTAELDEDELDTPAYMRRQPGHVVQFADEPEELPEVTLAEPPDVQATPSAVTATAKPSAWPFVEPVFESVVESAPTSKLPSLADEVVMEATADDESADSRAETVVSANRDDMMFGAADGDDFRTHDRRVEPSFQSSIDEPLFNDPLLVEPSADEVVLTEESITAATPPTWQAPEVGKDFGDETAADEPTIPSLSDELVAQAGTAAAAPVTAAAGASPAAPVVEPLKAPLRQSVIRPAAPTLSEPVAPSARAASSDRNADKPLSPAARRKIVALRLSCAERAEGASLMQLFTAERLEHGRFNIFHRVHGDGTVFSVASMVEPGTFDLDKMPQQLFPGVTLFMLLPGPLDGLVAWDQMHSCAQRLAHATGGVLQDERGKPLTAQMAERLREDVLDFQHLIGSLPTT